MGQCSWDDINLHTKQMLTNVYSVLTYFLSKGYEGSCNKGFCDCQEKR